MHRRIALLGMLALILSGSLLSVREASAYLPSNHPFYLTWAHTDEPVAHSMVSRTWMWGREGFTAGMLEPYADSPDGVREVQYFDKSRMEINDWSADPTSPWYVTNGLLVMELITGRMQVGHTEIEQRDPSNANVAGDADDPTGPTYQTMSILRIAPPVEDGTTIITRVNRIGALTEDPSLASHGVTAAHRVYVEGIDHQVASVFWEFMNSTGLVSDGGMTYEGKLFRDPFYATGLPITEAHWANVKVGGTYKDVLVQAFERRVLTYTPDNPDGWKVEAGNVGQHYYAWRYGPRSPGENEVLFSIPVGPEGLEYRFGSGETPELQNYGPTAISMAPDGTFWIADAAGNRLVHYNASGEKLNEIDLLEYDAAGVYDVEASDGDVWVLFANLNAGLFRLARFIPEGQLLRMYELHEDPILRDYALQSVGITITDGNEVVLDHMKGVELIQIVKGNGDPDNTTVTGRVYNGHHYEIRFDDLMTHTFIVDGHETVLRGRPGDFAIETGLVDMAGSASFVTRMIYVPDAVGEPFKYTAERISIAGERISVADLPLDDNFVYVNFDMVAAPDGEVYLLMTSPDRIDVLRLGFHPAG